MSDIFIGYSRSDSAIAERLVQRFQQEGWQVFIDRQTPRAVVVLWSAASRDSDFVLEEAEYGKRKEILFPAFIERVECPYGFGRIQTADLMGWNHQMEHAGLVQLLASLRVHLSNTVTPSPEPAEPAKLVKPAVQSILMPGQTFRDPLKSGGEGPLMTVIPIGHFLMGSSDDESGRSGDEGPQHEVIITQPFALGVYTVTFAEYDRFCQATSRKKPDAENWGRGEQPVIRTSWRDAQAYCDWLSQKTQHGYHLPSESEWEYACRAGTKTPFYTGEKINSNQANFNNKHGRTLPVGSFAPNAFGLYDMHGNIWEWIQDCWHDNYHNAPNDGSAWLEKDGGECNRRVVRGGSWSISPRGLRSAVRNGNITGGMINVLGFRIARDF